MEEQKYLQKLAEKWKDGTITPAEQNEFNQWYDSFDDSILEDPAAAESLPALKDRLYAQILKRENISIGQRGPSSKPISFWISVAAAAAIFLAIGTALIFLPPSKTNNNEMLSKHQTDFKPGGQKATLTLANGHTVELNNSNDAEIAEQSGISISKSKNGLLVYKVHGYKNPNSNQQEFNTVSTPIGGNYQIELPDGSKIWLNASSSIRFPASFEGLKERKVELNGEAYFEVAKDKNKPFKVSGKQQEVLVLGTHFNVNAYSNEESAKTTLLEGAVMMRNDKGQAAQLKPGQQASFKGSQWSIQNVNTTEVIAWQKGNFVFNEESLSSILRQLERWYGVQVDYSQVPDLKFSGVISKSAYLSKVLKMLELTGNIHLKLEGSTIKAHQ